MGTISRTAVLVGVAALFFVCNARAGVVTPVQTVSEFAIFKDDGNGSLDRHQDSYLGCITNYMQYLSAGTSYGYKQYDNPKGYDLSGWAESSDGSLSGTSHATWLTPQDNPNSIVGTINVGGKTYSAYSWKPDVLQFYVGWSRLDHDTDNLTYATAAQGYNLGIVMNQEQRYWDNEAKVVKHVITDLSSNTATNYNNVKINFTVLNTAIDPTVILSDDFSTVASDFPNNPFFAGEMPRDPKATAELKQTGANTFSGDWNYKFNSSDGGVLGDLVPTEAGYMVVKIDLIELGNLTEIIFYDFTHTEGDYDPFAVASYSQAYTRLDLTALGVGEGDSLYLVYGNDCCSHVPEPVTLGLLAIGGLGLGGAGWVRRRFARNVA